MAGIVRNGNGDPDGRDPAVSDRSGSQGVPQQIGSPAATSFGIRLELWGDKRVNGLVVIGALFVFVTSFLPWVQVTVAGGTVLTANGTDMNDGQITLALALLVIVLAIIIPDRETAATVAILLGTSIAGLGFYNLAELSHQGHELASRFVSVGAAPSLIVLSIGGLAIVAGGATAYMRCVN